MPGRPDFTTPGTGGSEQTVAINNRPEFRFVTLDQTGDVSAPGGSVSELYAPAGSVFQVNTVIFECPKVSNGDTGVHRVSMFGGGNLKDLTLFNSADSTLKMREGTPQAGTTTFPAPGKGLTQQIERLFATENEPLRFKYFNGGDTTQTGTREIKVVVKELSY